MTRSYKQGLTTLEGEFQIENLPIRGQLPFWLSGSLVRNGPGRFEIGSQQYRHWFDGLSMLHRFTFKNGTVSYANKYLQSRDYREAMDKGRISVPEFATDPSRSIFQRFLSMFDPGSIQNGNVNVARVGDSYLAMTEVPLPMEFDLRTLDTLGVFNYGGDGLPGVMTTAHPHFDPKSGALVNCITEMGPRNRYTVYHIPPGQKRRQRIGSVSVREPGYMHSFALTGNYVVLAEIPLVLNPFRLLFRDKPIAEYLEWRPGRGARLIAVDKRDGSLKTWTAEAFFTFHHINAFEQDGDLVLDIAAYDDPALIEAFYLERLRAGGPVPASQFRRYRLPAHSSTADYEVMVSDSIELPRLNYGYSNTRNYRFAYGVSNRADRPGDLYNQLVKVDACQRESRVWLEEDCYPGEPVFAAAPGSSAEDEGVILSVVLNAATGTSFLLVLDAHSFSEIARAEVPHHIPLGFHGEYFAD